MSASNGVCKQITRGENASPSCFWVLKEKNACSLGTSQSWLRFLWAWIPGGGEGEKLEWILHKVCLEKFQSAGENGTLQRYQRRWLEPRVFKAAEGSWTAEPTLILIRISHSGAVSDSRGYQARKLYKPQPSGTALLQRSDSSESAARIRTRSIPAAVQVSGEHCSACTFRGVFLPIRKRELSTKCVRVAKWRL